MALTAQEFAQLKLHWGLVIQAIHAGIDEIPKGDGETIAELLSTWRGGYSKPSEAQIEAALIDTVLPDVAAIEQDQADQAAATSDIKARFLASALANKSPDEIYTLMQGQVDGWSSLAEAQSDLRAWLPLMAAAIAWLVLQERN